MAKAEHVEIVRQGAEAIRKWREAHSGIRLDLRAVDLSLAPLRGADLREADFSGADLVGANLEEADLGGADLQGGDLDAANLAGARLRQANLSGAKLSCADLRRADLEGADLRRADVGVADLRGAHLGKAHLGGADLSLAKLGGAHLSEADLGGADLSLANLGHADLHQANLHQANLRQVHLAHADLSQANLGEANCGEANLREANLSQAVLCEAVLTKANLRGAALRGADLRGAKLRGADLSEADLTRTVLSRADLHGAKLCGTHFRRANLGETNFQDAQLIWGTFSDMDLSVAKALETVRHRGPSTIGVDTLYNSKGKIPETFLRGCGLSDWELAAAKLYSRDLGQQELEHVVYTLANLRNGESLPLVCAFISCSHEDLDFAHKLHDALQRKGIRCWLDEQPTSPTGAGEHPVARRRLRDRVLLCASQQSLASTWVAQEIDQVLQTEWLLTKERGKKARALFLLNLDGYLLSGAWHSDPEWQITSRLVADFTGWKTDETRFRQELDKLIETLRAT
jgi:uncharacterized protein YjbI with pentapeptide repeats